MSNELNRLNDIIERQEKGFVSSYVEGSDISVYKLEDFYVCGMNTCGEIPTEYIKFKLNGIKLHVPLCNKHYEQIRCLGVAMGGAARRDRESPIVLCKDNGHNYYFHCSYCGKNHYHGRDEGHRVAHCINDNSPYNDNGYILKLDENNDINDNSDYETVTGVPLSKLVEEYLFDRGHKSELDSDSDN